jgi:hypothetical protein
MWSSGLTDEDSKLVHSNLPVSIPRRNKMCRWRASPANRGRRVGCATSGPTPRRRSDCVAPISTRSVEGTRVIRSPHSDSGPPRCYPWSRAGHPRREASGSGGGRGGICVGQSAVKGGTLGQVSIIESLLSLLRVGEAPSTAENTLRSSIHKLLSCGH